jgi:VWFA-related protein
MTVVSRSCRALTLTLGVAWLAAISLFAQKPRDEEQSPQFTIKSNVDRVVVDVVVNDADGKPVHGLSREDFSVSEDGKPEKILSFDLHSLDSNAGYFAKLPPMPPNTFVNIATEPEKGPLYVLLLDLVNTEQDDQPYARQQLLKFVENKPEGTRFAVFVLSDGLHLVQGFSANRAQLYATLDPHHSIPHVPRIFLLGPNYGKGDSFTASSVFNNIALYLMGLPGRKNIIWVSGAFPLDLFPHEGDRPDTRRETMETLDALTRSGSAIYPVDVTGVQVYPAGRMTGSTPGGAGSANGAPGTPVVSDSGTPGSEMRLAGRVGDSASTNNTVADVVASITGGRAFYSRNDLKEVLETAAETGADYYTLTYSPSNKTFDGKLRTIRVQLDKKGYHLEYRREYLATGPQSAILPSIYKPKKGDDTLNLRPIGDSLAAYMQHGAPIARQVYFQAHVRTLDSPHLATPAQMANLVDQPTYFRERHKKHPNKNLAPATLQTYLVEYQIIARIPNLEVAAGAYDTDGVLLNGDVEEASSANPKALDPKAQYTHFRVQQTIDVPAGAVSLRLGVRDLSTDRMGTMEIALPLAPEPAESPLAGSQAPVSSSTKP